MLEKIIAKVVMIKGEPGASGDYGGLINKPKINGMTLQGNKTAAALGLASAAQLAQTSARIDQILHGNTAVYAGIEMHVYETEPQQLSSNLEPNKYVIDGSFSVPAGYVIIDAAVGRQTPTTWAWKTEGVELWAQSTSVIMRYSQSAPSTANYCLRLIIAVVKEIDLSELLDLRVDVRGDTHSSAGDAVRAQIQDLQDQINDLSEELEARRESNMGGEERASNSDSR